MTSENCSPSWRAREAFGRPWRRGRSSASSSFASDYASYLTGEVISVSSRHP